MMASKDRTLLLQQFVSSFQKLNDMRVYGKDPVALQLCSADADEEGWHSWQPLRMSTAASALEPLYAQLPSRFPPLFEGLLLSYRWAEVDLRSYRLLANPLGEELNTFLGEIQKDKGLWQALSAAGYIQFGKGPDVDYDPICFDTNHKRNNGDCRVVKFDHEEILCNNRLKIVRELADSFEDLVLQTITAGDRA